jgi:hypothetical protein
MLLSFEDIFIFTVSCFDQIQLEYVEDQKDFYQKVEQGKHCVTKVDDVERNGYRFTDGNGLISKGLARLIAEKLEYLIECEGNVCISFFLLSISPNPFLSEYLLVRLSFGLSDSNGRL